MRSTIAKYHDCVNSLVQEFDLSGPDLGPDFNVPMSFQEASSNLQKYRVRKKFEVPSKKANAKRAKYSVLRMLMRDCIGFSFTPHLVSQPERARLYKARIQIHEAFRNFKLDFSNLVLPTGETSISKAGDVSIYSKLNDVRQWTCTADSFDLVATLIYQTRWLKILAKKHFGSYTKEDNDRLFYAFQGHPKVGFEIFKCKLLDIMRIVEGSRITTVPKNNSVDRVINCEPLFNMVLQSVIGRTFRRVLRRYGITLEVAQSVHRSMIALPHVATIDLSNASDSNWMTVIEWLYPKRVVSLLTKARSPVGRYKGEKHTFNMLSPMGNGFTFEVMTATIFFLLRGLDENVKVFGDDIIINNNVAQDGISILEACGYEVNKSKTFINSRFRESCGGFYYEGVDKSGYIESYDITYCHDIVDAIVTVNKLLRIRNLLNASLIETHVETVTPLLCMNACPSRDIGSSYISYDMRKVKKEDPDFQKFFKKNRGYIANRVNQFQYKAHKVDLSFAFSKKTKNYVQLGRWKKQPLCVSNKALIGTYLYSGRCVTPTTRDIYISRELFLY